MELVSIGVDVGQRQDPTAICVAETQERRRDNGDVETIYLVRHLERLPLMTSYPDIAKRIVEIVDGVARLLAGDAYAYERARRAAESKITLRIDATGVGGPVVDLIRDALRDRAIILEPITFTHGDRYDRRSGKLGKAYLVSRLQALLQTGRIKLPKTPESEQLARELMDYEIRIDQNANDRYGAFRVGSHDDMVTALGLACLVDPVALRVQYAAPIYI